MPIFGVIDYNFSFENSMLTAMVILVVFLFEVSLEIIVEFGKVLLLIVFFVHVMCQVDDFRNN